MRPATRTLQTLRAATAALLALVITVAAGCSTADDSAVASSSPAGRGDDCCPPEDCCAIEALATTAAGDAAAVPTSASPATRPATGPAAAAASPATVPATRPAADAASRAADWRALFDGKTLTGWKPSGFAGQGEPEVKDERIVLPVGEGLTGVTYAGDDLPKVNYEVEVVARRAEGHDFFCGLTVPVNETHASLIVGGWGGAVVGVSCIDGEDAAHNDTTQYMKFETGTWYRVRIRVLPEKIQAWVDDKRLVDAPTKGKKVDIRVGTEEARPLGLATWQTTAEISSVRIRKVEGEGK
jgi:hypothetical protein